MFRPFWSSMNIGQIPVTPNTTDCTVIQALFVHTWAAKPEASPWK